MLAKFSALRKFKGRGIHSWVVDTIALGPVAYVVQHLSDGVCYKYCSTS